MYFTLSRATWPTLYPFIINFDGHLPGQKIFNTHPQLLAGPLSQLLGQLWSILKLIGFNSHAGQGFWLSLSRSNSMTIRPMVSTN